MNKPLIAANWKMHKTIAEANEFAAELKKIDIPNDRDVLIAAGYTLLPGLVAGLEGTPVITAAQNLFYEEQGAFTAEVSPLQVKDVGCSHVLIGHSERRHVFGEDNKLINKKMLACEQHGIIPVFCLGETLDQRKSGNQESVVKEQLESGLQGLSDDFIKELIVAYEPVWAIGTGETATPEQAEEMQAFLKGLLPSETRILYGGSVKPGNAQELIEKPSVDGFLIGGASLNIDDFSAIIGVKL